MNNKIYYFYSELSEASLFYKLFLENLSQHQRLCYSTISVDSRSVREYLRKVWHIDQVPAIIFNGELLKNDSVIKFLQSLPLKKSISQHKDVTNCTTPISKINLPETTGNLELDEQIQKAVKTTSIMDKVKHLQLEREKEALIK